MKIVRDPDTGQITVIELTRRNLTVLLAKLDDPRSAKLIVKGDSLSQVGVRAVEDEEHYRDRPPGPMIVDGKII